MGKRKTAGELSLKTQRDTTNYDMLDAGHALCDDVLDGLMECIRIHKKIIDEPEFCVGLILAGDPLIQNVMRRKFYAFPFLPKPRPNQSVFLYRKENDSICRLWVLPRAQTMAVLSTMSHVAPQWKTMKRWADAFYDGKFFELIREQQKDPSLLSESEYLNLHRDELIKAGTKQVDSVPTEAFDFSKISIKKIIDTKTAVSD